MVAILGTTTPRYSGCAARWSEAEADVRGVHGVAPESACRTRYLTAPYLERGVIGAAKPKPCATSGSAEQRLWTELLRKHLHRNLRHLPPSFPFIRRQVQAHGLR